MQFIRGILSNDSAPQQGNVHVAPVVKKVPTKKLLVIEAQKDKRDLTKYFKKFTVHGEKIEVLQAGWSEIDVTSYFTTESKAPNPVTAYVSLRMDGRYITFKPDFVLVRNETKEPQPAKVKKKHFFHK